MKNASFLSRAREQAVVFDGAVVFRRSGQQLSELLSADQ
jgi:hypothetical protein